AHRIGYRGQTVVEVVPEQSLPPQTVNGLAEISVDLDAGAVVGGGCLNGLDLVAGAVVLVPGLDAVAVDLTDQAVITVVAEAVDALLRQSLCHGQRRAVTDTVVGKFDAFTLAIDLRGLPPIGVVLEAFGALLGQAQRTYALNEVAHAIVLERGDHTQSVRLLADAVVGVVL